MIIQQLKELMRWGWENRIIIVDRDELWGRLGGVLLAGQGGYEVHSIQDEMMLRYLYEKDYRTGETKCIMVIANPKIKIPFDLECRFYVTNLSLKTIFPQLSVESLHGLPGPDYEHLAFALDWYAGTRMDSVLTLQFCSKGIYERKYALPYAEVLLQRCIAAALENPNYLSWIRIASWYGQALMLMRGWPLEQGIVEQINALQIFFKKWMETEYQRLSAEVNMEQPVLLSGAADFLRRQSGKVALLVLDGLSFENLYTIQKYLPVYSHCMEIRGVFSFLPSVTTVARQCLFAGKLPVELSNLTSLTQEEKQWRAFWKSAGLREEEICFAKGETLELDTRWKTVGLVINTIDDLMHNQLQGMDGMARDIEAWIKNGKLQTMIADLHQAGFQVYLTSDHGNTPAIAQGRFKNAGVLAEPASKRAVMYQSFADPIELEGFDVFLYDGTYLPEGSKAYLFVDGACYGNKGKEYITHGGMSIEEVIVPFVRIGAK